jgi:hypothetical protein
VDGEAVGKLAFRGTNWARNIHRRNRIAGAMNAVNGIHSNVLRSGGLLELYEAGLEHWQAHRLDPAHIPADCGLCRAMARCEGQEWIRATGVEHDQPA